jgi:hypothetical protein
VNSGQRSVVGGQGVSSQSPVIEHYNFSAACFTTNDPLSTINDQKFDILSHGGTAIMDINRRYYYIYGPVPLSHIVLENFAARCVTNPQRTTNHDQPSTIHKLQRSPQQASSFPSRMEYQMAQMSGLAHSWSKGLSPAVGDSLFVV